MDGIIIDSIGELTFYSYKYIIIVELYSHAMTRLSC
jgi:hypothetical protein